MVKNIHMIRKFRALKQAYVFYKIDRFTLDFSLSSIDSPKSNIK